MRPTLAWLPLGVLLSTGCALVGYNFDGYGPAGTSTGGSAGAGGGKASTSGAGEGGGETTHSGATGTGGTASCTWSNAVASTDIMHESKLLIVADLAGPFGSVKERLPDVVVASDTAPQTSVLYNDGTNKLKSGGSLSSQTIGAPSNITFGDLNADGRPDLVELSAAAGQVSYAFNIGNEFNDWKSLSVAYAGMPGAVTFAQIDNSGPEDIVVALGPKLTTFLVGPAGAILPMPLERPLPFAAESLSIADLDGDGVNDYVITNMTSNLLAIISGASASTAAADTYSVAMNPVQSGIADFNEDGALDIVASAAGALQVSLLLNNNKDKGHFKFAPVNAGIPTSGLAVADYDGDKHQDLALSGNGEIVVLLGKGDGTFKSPIIFPGLPRSTVIRAADMNGDGKTDLVEGSDTVSKVRVFLSCW